MGNIEANDAMMGGADVIVADGFYRQHHAQDPWRAPASSCYGAQEVFMSDTTRHQAGRRPGEGRHAASLRRLLDPSEVGGTPFLGISKPVIKAHGSSDALAIQNAVRQARDFA